MSQSVSIHPVTLISQCISGPYLKNSVPYGEIYLQAIIILYPCPRVS